MIGLYTSPHLVAVRERIRIDGAPLPEDEFAKYFFEVWDKLVANNTVCYFARAHAICLRDLSRSLLRLTCQDISDSLH